MPRVHFVKKARKDHPNGIKRGDSYYWWEFRYGGARYSKTGPKPSQLTQSSFLQQYHTILENFEEAMSKFSLEDLEPTIENMISEIDDMYSQCEDSLSNMPVHLQDTSNSGILLTFRMDMLEEWRDNLENVDTSEYDPDTDCFCVEEVDSEDCECATGILEDRLAEILESDPGLY